MSAAAAPGVSSNLLGLIGSPAKAPNKSNDPSVMFGVTMSSTMQSRAPSAVEDVVNQPQAGSASASSDQTPSAPASATKGDDRPPPQAASTPPNSGQSTQANGPDDGKSGGADKGKRATKSDDDSGDTVDNAATASAAAAQLQGYVQRGLDAAQVRADASGNKLLKSAGLAKALLDDQGSAKVTVDASKADPKALIDNAVGNRQGLPEAAANVTAVIDVPFSGLVDSKLRALNAAAQQVASGQGAPRNEQVRGVTDKSSVSTTVFQPVGGDGWDGAIGHQVVMMVSNGQQDVELQLNPPHLGPLDIKLSLNQDQASLTFVAAHAPVREALQASLPKLHEMLAESGIQLAQANVQARTQNGGDGAARDERGRRGSRARGDNVAAIEDIGTTTAGKRPRLISGLPGNVNLFV
jgi:flagellar hook-length control protein FliK